MTTWVLILLFVHADGVHSLTVKFDSQSACELAASQWRSKEVVFQRIRETFARCHAGGSK